MVQILLEIQEKLPHTVLKVSDMSRQSPDYKAFPETILLFYVIYTKLILDLNHNLILD